MDALSARVWAGEPGLLTDDDQQVVLEALAACGATAARMEVIDTTRTDAATALAWGVLAAVPLQGFLSALGEKLADDAHGRLLAAVKLVAERTRAVRRGRQAVQASRAGSQPSVSPPPLVLMDSASRLKIVIEPDLPAEAISLLVALDLSRFTVGPLHYDRAAHRWRSELDEAAGGDR